MAGPKKKNSKHIDRDEKKIPETGSKKTIVSDVFLDELQGAFTKFDKMPESKRIELYGNQAYLEQFRQYFTKEYPNLLDKIDKKDLPVYIKALENKGFKLSRIVDDMENNKLHAEFRPEDTEEHVIQESLGELKDFCDDDINNLPADTFDRFASAAGFDANTLNIDSTGKIKTVDNLPGLRKKFIENEGIDLKQTSAEHAERILTPQYSPTERMMINALIRKIHKTLSGTIKTAFAAQFPLPVTIFSPYQDLVSFKRERLQFVDDHAAEIDKDLAKKLDALIVTNGDIQQEILKTGRKFDDTKGFSELDQYFRVIFNKLVTRQLFEEVQKTQESIDHYITAMGTTFKEFPPYVNEILKIYPFNDTHVSAIDTSFHADLQSLENQMLTLQQQHAAAATEQERETIRKKIRDIKHQQELRRWKAYIAFLATKDALLAQIFEALVQNKFNFSVLSAEQQQTLLSVLMKNKLQDTIKNKVHELLSVTEEDLTRFVDNLFDLKNMDITIPTRTGPIPLKFLKKEFMSTEYTELPGVESLEKIKNLPLNFLVQVTEGNAGFFEESVIFKSLFTDFLAKNGTFCINDAYKVRIKQGDKIAEGYLSPYSILDERNTEESDGKELYLYSQPITAPHQERTLVNRNKADGSDSGIPVVIKDDVQQECDLEIIDKQINLNGEALGALLFGYVLGQESMHADLSPEKEKELGEKLGKLDIYREKQEKEVTSDTDNSDESKVEINTEEKKFMKERQQLAGYNFPEPQYKDNGGFIKGTRLFVPFADSTMPPYSSTGSHRAWMDMEIVDIDKNNGTFTVKLRGGETRLGKYEGVKKTLPISPDAFATIKEHFGGKFYKMPNVRNHSFDQWMEILMSSKAAEDLPKCFSTIQYKSGKFVFVGGEESGKDVEYFGRYEQQVVEDPDQEQGKRSLYKVTSNANNTFSIKGEFVDNDGKKNTYTRELDYPAFLLFINEKQLQPKSKQQADGMKKRQDLADQETKSKRGGFSINNVFGFFKNSFNKLKDSVKKHDEERTEDLTDLLTNQGQLYGNIGKFFSPFGRISSSFETMGAEYFSERDSRLRKKVEKRKKFYEDADFSLLYNNRIQPMIKGEIVIKPHYKAAAMLLAMIAKGKGPYNRHPEFAAKGMRVNILMGKEHQARYFAMREKLIRELEQGSSVYGSIWTNNKKNEILELEMKYIVHVMDGRQLGIQDGDKTKYYFYGKYSKQFIDELEKGYTGFFSQSTVDEGYGKMKGASFDFARAEFFRLLGDRPQQAIPCLKVMATKAVTPNQWRIFEMAVMTGMLSGIFVTMTMSETQSMIKNICRTRGFVPGIRVEDIHQQTKLQRMLDIFSNKGFSNTTKYNPSKFSFSDISGGTKDFVKRDSTGAKPGVFQNRISSGDTLNTLSSFFMFKGKNAEGRTLLEIYSDPKTPASDKMLIKEFIDNSNEKNEGLDSDVRNNPYALAGSILTKSQSAVNEMMKIDEGGFKAKDGDEKQTMEAFFEDMRKTIPTHKLSSIQEVKFYLEKFFNRFDERGFSGTNKTALIKRLKRCKDNASRREVDDVLYYSIVGQICDSFRRAQMPDIFLGALESWKGFFKSNLSTILDTDVIASTFGGASYKQDYYRYTPQLEPWENCINLVDRELKPAYLSTLSGEERKTENAKLTRLRSDNNFLNYELYDMADKLYRNTGIDNRFRLGVNDDSLGSKVKKSAAMKKAGAVTGAKIKNPEVVDKVRKILDLKSLDEDLPDDYVPLMEEEYEYMD